MAKYQSQPETVDAYRIVSIGENDGEGNQVVETLEDGNAGTVPFTIPGSELVGYKAGDWIVIDAEGSQELWHDVEFAATYHAAQ